MNAIITFFIWLFGWSPAEAPVPSEFQSMTPTTHQRSASLDGFEPERFKTGKKQTVTIIIYDDTHFRVK